MFAPDYWKPKTPARVDEMLAEWKTLIAKPNAKPTQETVLALAAKYGVVSGKWMLVHRPEVAWPWYAKIKEATKAKQLGTSAKVRFCSCALLLVCCLFVRCSVFHFVVRRFETSPTKEARPW